MIDDKMIDQLRKAKNFDELEALGWFTLGNMVETLSALWRVARAAEDLSLALEGIVKSEKGPLEITRTKQLKQALSALHEQEKYF